MRKFAHSILQCLEVLSRNKIIHCDLKPENILLKQQGRSGLKVVQLPLDLFFTSRQGYRFWLIMLRKEENIHIHTVSFLQSTRGHFGGGVFNRHRHVELRCVLPKIYKRLNMLLGCILAELLTGYPLLPGDDEGDQLACMIELLGMPPKVDTFHDSFDLYCFF